MRLQVVVQKAYSSAVSIPERVSADLRLFSNGVNAGQGDVSIPERVSADLRHWDNPKAFIPEPVSIPERVSADLRPPVRSRRRVPLWFQSLRGFQPI